MATVKRITAGLVRKIPQPQLGPYHMVEIPTMWEIELAEGEDPMAVELEMRQMISEVHKQIALPFIKAALPQQPKVQEGE